MAGELQCIFVQGIGDTNESNNTDPIIQFRWFHILESYLPHHLKTLQAISSKLKKTKYDNGERWTSQLIDAKPLTTMERTPSSSDNSDKTTARPRQTTQQRVEMAYAYGPHMLAHDQRFLDIPLEGRLQSEPLVSMRGPRRFLSLYIKVPMIHRLNSIPVIKTSVLISLRVVQLDFVRST
jgi:hypothetical protein